MIKKSLCCLLLIANICNAMDNNKLVTCIEHDYPPPASYSYIRGCMQYIAIQRYTRYQIDSSNQKVMLEQAQRKQLHTEESSLTMEADGPTNFTFDYNEEHVSLLRKIYGEAALSFLMCNAVDYPPESKFHVLAKQYHEQQIELGSGKKMIFD